MASIYDRNDNYSGNVFTENAYWADKEKIPELQEQSWGEGYYRAYIRPLIPKFLRRQPTASDEYTQLQRDADRISKILQDTRTGEDLIWINGRILPGIFQGLSINGGIRKETIKAKVRSNQRIRGENINNITKQFTIDKGDRPIAGIINYLMLDDYYSTAKSKAIEFYRIITDWRTSEVYKQDSIERVFLMVSFLTGSDWPAALNFSRIKIVNYDIDMDNQGLEGQINCSFNFEQFEVTNQEGRLNKPNTEIDSTGGEPSVMSTPESLPPGQGTFDTGL